MLIAFGLITVLTIQSEWCNFPRQNSNKIIAIKKKKVYVIERQNLFFPSQGIYQGSFIPVTCITF